MSADVKEFRQVMMYEVSGPSDDVQYRLYVYEEPPCMTWELFGVHVESIDDGDLENGPRGGIVVTGLDLIANGFGGVRASEVELFVEQCLEDALQMEETEE